MTSSHHGRPLHGPLFLDASGPCSQAQRLLPLLSFCLLLPILGSQVRLQGQALRQLEVPDVCSTDRQMVQLLRLFALLLVSDTFEVRVHRHVDTSYGANNHRPILQFNGHGLARQLH